MLTSSPPLIDIANLNITHYQRQADLIHALHIAAQNNQALEGSWITQAAKIGNGILFAILVEGSRIIIFGTIVALRIRPPRLLNVCQTEPV